MASGGRRRRHRLHHRHRGIDRAIERAAVSVLRPHQGRIPRHRSREFAWSLSKQIRDLSALRRADADVALKGLIAGSSLMAGAFIAKRFVLKLDPDVFRLVMDGIMLVAGLSMVFDALWSAPVVN